MRERERERRQRVGVSFCLRCQKFCSKTCGKSKRVAMTTNLHDSRWYRSSRLPNTPDKKSCIFENDGGRIQNPYIASFEPCLYEHILYVLYEDMLYVSYEDMFSMQIYYMYSMKIYYMYRLKIYHTYSLGPMCPGAITVTTTGQHKRSTSKMLQLGPISLIRSPDKEPC